MGPVVSGAMAALPKVEQSSTLKGSNKRIVFLLMRGGGLFIYLPRVSVK